MLKLTRFLVFGFCLFFWTAQAQQDPMFTKYMFNTLNYNPAYAGSVEYLSIVAIWREQWIGWNDNATGGNGGAPRTQTISAHQPFQDRVGLGLSITNDAIGPTASTSVNGNYAYKIPFSQGTLSLGLNAGVTYWRADWDKLTYKDPRYLDPVYANGNPTIWIPTVGAGTYYYTDRFYAGFSVPRLFNYDLRSTDEDEQLGIEINAQTYRHFYFTSGGAIDVRGNDIVFKPSILIKSVGLFGAFASNRNSNRRVATPTEFDIDLSALFYNKLWLGFSFRSAFEKFSKDLSSHDSADVWAAIYFNNGFRLGAAYDFSLTELNDYNVGSLEIMLGYDFNYQVSKVVTPRYF